MQFNDSSTKLGLIQDITFLTGVDTNKYPIADRTRNINSWNSHVWTWIFEAYGGWQFDDDNSSAPTTMPFGTVTLVSGTSTYGLPTGTLTIRKVDILQSDGSTWRPLDPLPLEMIGVGEGEFLKTSGTPRYYRPVGDVVKLYPAPNYNGTNYLKVFFDRDMLAFDAADTTEVPGFASPFHRILSVGASLDYAIANGVNAKIISLTNLVNDYEKRLKKFYAKRFLDNFPTRIRVHDSVQEYR
jgi:hypothetical protein